MLNMIGGNKIYTVPEVQVLLKNLRKFKVIGVDIDELPLAEEADKTCAYFKATGEEVFDGGNAYPLYNIYIPVEKEGEWIWCLCSGGGGGEWSTSYEALGNLPFYKLLEDSGETTLSGDVSSVLAQALSEDEIKAVVNDNWN